MGSRCSRSTFRPTPHTLTFVCCERENTSSNIGSRCSRSTLSTSLQYSILSRSNNPASIWNRSRYTYNILRWVKQTSRTFQTECIIIVETPNYTVLKVSVSIFYIKLWTATFHFWSDPFLFEALFNYRFSLVPKRLNIADISLSIKLQGHEGQARNIMNFWSFDQFHRLYSAI